jgi:hypothetical protein
MRLVKYQNEANIKITMLKLTKTKKIVMEHNFVAFTARVHA